MGNDVEVPSNFAVSRSGDATWLGEAKLHHDLPHKAAPCAIVLDGSPR